MREKCIVRKRGKKWLKVISVGVEITCGVPKVAWFPHKKENNSNEKEIYVIQWKNPDRSSPIKTLQVGAEISFFL